MEKYSRVVIDLYKEILSDLLNNHQVNSSRVLETKKELAKSVTEEKILGRPTQDLETLLKDVEFINELL